MFLRFIVRRQDPDSRQFSGIFTEAYTLADSDNVDKQSEKCIRKILSWFRDNLAVPLKTTRKQSDRAISWFRTNADGPLVQIWDLVSILKVNGIDIEMIKTNDPGTIVWEDDSQVFAIPPKSRRIKSKF